MTIFWFLMVALVLGGLLASLWYQETRRGIWFRKVRVPALAPACARGPLARSAPTQFACGRGFLAPPGSISRASPGQRRSPGWFPARARVHGGDRWADRFASERLADLRLRLFTTCRRPALGRGFPSSFVLSKKACRTTL